jgi:Asp-tRNA(Asn)/Glu-tRNA(Gln) amidotransferase A subunit family amidase
MDFQTATAGGLAEQVRRRELSARELVEHALSRIEALNPTINAFVALDPEGARAAAADLDDRIARGDEVGPLAGVPIGVKDLEDAAGLRTTHGSRCWADAEPAVRDSVLVERLKAAGCIVVGKTNTPELGYMADTRNEVFGQTRNPWGQDRSPGGSSGGSAAAVAAGMVPLATGSDGGGSIRIPSALCGLSGFKPSLGRVPTGGSHAPDWHHLSTKGPMARRVSDLALALDAVIGPDPTDLRSLPMPDGAWVGALDGAHLPMRVAWSPTLGYANVDSEILDVCERAVAKLDGMGVEVVETKSVFDEDPVGAWLTLASSYNLRTLSPFRDTAAWERIDPGLRSFVEYAEGLTALQVVQAEDMAHALNLRLVELFHRTRLLIIPTVAGQTPRAGGQGTINGVEDVNWVQLTYPFNMSRSPAGTVCVGFTGDGMPVGLQLIGPQHGDAVVLRAMAALETAMNIEQVAPV